MLPLNNSIAAEKMTKNGTSFSKTVPGNLNKSKLPTKAPLKINSAYLADSNQCPFISCNEDKAEPAPVKINAEVFVIFAITGGAPAISKAGYETSDA